MVHRPSTVWIVIIGLVCVVVVGRLLFHALGYATAYSAYEAVQLAEKYVEEGRDARDCFKIRTFIPTYPPLASFQADCIHEFAKLTLDPSVCELLLPSEYGLDCLGTVANSLAKGFGCSSYESGKIYCSSGVRGKNIGIDDCTRYSERDLQDWCYGERTRMLAGIYECDRVSADPVGLREECQRRYAFKEKDPALCDPIQDKRRKKGCELKINAWLKYPELRDSFYFGTPVPVDSPTGA